jgi:hypothetical protein
LCPKNIREIAENLHRYWLPNLVTFMYYLGMKFHTRVQHFLPRGRFRELNFRNCKKLGRFLKQNYFCYLWNSLAYNSFWSTYSLETFRLRVWSLIHR